MRNRRFALGPRSLATTRGISLDFSSSGYLDVSVRRVTSAQPMCSAGSNGEWPPLGCPIRRSAGHRVCAPHRGLSQLVTSFVGFQCQGIHRVPLPSSSRWFGTYIHCAQFPARAIRCDLLEKENIVFVTLCSSQGTRGGTLKTGYCAPGGVEGISGKWTGTALKVSECLL